MYSRSAKAGPNRPSSPSLRIFTKQLFTTACAGGSTRIVSRLIQSKRGAVASTPSIRNEASSRAILTQSVDGTDGRRRHGTIGEAYDALEVHDVRILRVALRPVWLQKGVENASEQSLRPCRAHRWIRHGILPGNVVEADAPELKVGHHGVNA